MAEPWVDTSHYQAVDLPAYFALHDRLANKVSEGVGYEDPTFAPRYAYARANGKPFLGYHFDRARFDGADQFDWFEDCIRRAGGPRPYPLDLWCLDSEDTNYPAGARAAALKFTGRAVAQGFSEGSVYSGLWYAQPNGIRLDMLVPGWRRGWLSDYNAAHADATMPLPAGWAREQIIARQYTSSATVVGVTGRCDANRTLNEWTEEEDLTPSEHAMLAQDHHDIQNVLVPGLAKQAAAMAALTAKVDALALGGGQLDVAALVKAINDDAAKRMEA